ncbi:monocarboxylate transporter 14-like isoform X2 [Anneissia japonica]|uniref:monocarboxylate transporter 14-like isoform X2 n=1 Tax=Anneissia japonica TaxID=1529436 RepID=UPI00142556F2|nr:monocarboxylate transporter 14-like isoform X2 [Anneissia japonica]
MYLSIKLQRIEVKHIGVRMEWKSLPTLFGILAVILFSVGTAGPCLSFFLVDFTIALENSSATVGMTQSLYFGAVLLLGPLAVIMSKRYGDKETIIVGCVMVSGGLMMTSQTTSVWQLFISHSLIAGTGTSLVVSSIVFIIGHHFSCSAVYLGFMYSGSASGMLLTPICCAQLKRFLGFRGTILVLGALSMNSIPVSLFVFKRYSKKHGQSKRTESPAIAMTDECVGSVVDQKIIRNESDDDTNRRTLSSEMCRCVHGISTLSLFLENKNLILLTIVRALTEYAYIGFFIHFTASLIYKGVPEQEAAFALGSFGLGSLCGRLTAFLPEYIHLWNKNSTFIMAMLIVGTLMIVFDYIRTVYVTIMSAALIGYFIGWYLILFPALVRGSVCKERFKDAYGAINIPAGIICTFAGYTVGLVYDISESYRLSFFIVGGIFVLSCVLMTIANIVPKLQKQ